MTSSLSTEQNEDSFLGLFFHGLCHIESESHLLGITTCFSQFLRFIIWPFVSGFLYSCILSVLTYNIRLDIVVIQIWEMLSIQVGLFHCLTFPRLSSEE